MGRLRWESGGRTRNPEAEWWAWLVPGYGMTGGVGGGWEDRGRDPGASCAGARQVPPPPGHLGLQ